MDLTLADSNINFAVALLGGIITFFASCLLPLVPTYIAYLSGVSLSKENDETTRGKIFVNSLMFTLGFIIVFVVLGVTATIVGNSLAVNRLIIQKIGGIFFIVMGFFMLGKAKIWILQKDLKIGLPKNFTKWRLLNSFLVGITFGFAWTPCVGPVLAVILFWASQAKTSSEGILLLLAYGIGLGLPFLLVGMLFEVLAPKLYKVKHLGRILYKLSALFIVLMGFLLFIGRVDLLSVRLLEFFGLNVLAI